MEWTRRVGGRLDDLPDEERRELRSLLLEEATIDGENKVTLTLAIPPDEEADKGCCADCGHKEHVRQQAHYS